MLKAYSRSFPRPACYLLQLTFHPKLQTFGEFATKGKRSTLTREQARLLVENLDEEAFHTDQSLLKQLLMVSDKPMGMILLSQREICVLCGSKSLARSDKHSSVVIHDDSLGTLPATHFHKYCSKRSCSCTQF